MNNLRFRIYLEKHIKEPYIRINKEHIKPNKKGEVQIASDTFFIKDCKNKNFLDDLPIYFLFSLCFSPIGGFIIQKFCELNISFLNVCLLTTSISFTLISLFKAYFYFLGSEKKLILDRLNGLITFPRPYFLKSKIIRLQQLQAFKIRKGTAADYGGGSIHIDLYLKSKYSDYKFKLDTLYTDTHITSSNVNDGEIESYWNFIVWYMDKNRALPKGTAFDNYRKKDLERLKTEGNPSPLHNEPKYIFSD